MKNFIKALLMSLLICLFIPMPAGALTPIQGLVAFTLLVAILYLALKFNIKTPINAKMAGVDVEKWADTLIKMYWQNNEFAKQAVQVAKEYIYNSKVVHIPVINQKPNVTRNRTSFPASVDVRTDTEILYLIDKFFVDPWMLSNAEKYELSYNKMASMMEDQANAAIEAAAEWLLYHWTTYTQTTLAGTTSLKAKQLRTTGADASATLDGATGTRKMLTVADFGKAKTMLNKAKVPFTDRFAIVSSDMLDQVTQDPEYKKAEKIYEQELIEGTVAKIKGFNIFERGSACRFDNAGTPVSLSPATLTAATSNEAALLYHKGGVESAVGGVEWFDDMGNPLYYGDIMSCILRASGRIRRDDSVITIIQAS